MKTDLLNALTSCLREAMPMYKTRFETFCVLVFGVLTSRTVNLTHIAALFPGDAEVSSNYRRLQRFFAEVSFDFDALARFIVRFMGIENMRWKVALDRTNWKFGRTHINILVLAIVHQGVAIPLLWTVLGRAGNSSTKCRTALLKRFFRIFGTDKIAELTGDREFVGEDWMGFLLDHNIPFILRLREDFIITWEGRQYTLYSLLRRLRKGRGSRILRNCILGKDPGPDSPCVDLACKRLASGELLILATNTAPEKALANYRNRWQIEDFSSGLSLALFEALFAACKTRGFNFEDTHLTRSIRIKKMIAVLAIAFCWSHRTGEKKNAEKPIPTKKHGRKAQSIFRYGFDKLRQLLSHAPAEAISQLCTFLKIPPPSIVLQGGSL